MKTTLNMMVQQLGRLNSGQEKIQNDLNAKELGMETPWRKNNSTQADQLH